MEYIKGSEPYSYTSNSDIGVLVIHGFTGTTSSLASFNKVFTKEGYNVECPRLRGHGTTWMNLEKTTYDDWIEDVEKSLDDLKKRTKKIFLAGLSMGGALVLYLAENHPEIKGLMIVNNALVMKDARLFFLPILKYILRTTPGIGSDLKDITKKEICYDTVPTRAVIEMMKLLNMVKKDLAKVNQPILIFKSKVDHVVPTVSAIHTFENISSTQKELIWLENSFHVATMDFDKDLICNKSADFIKNIL